MLVSFLRTVAVLAFTVSSVFGANAALGSYNIGSDITVSGLSSGGFMAVQVYILKIDLLKYLFTKILRSMSPSLTP